MWRDPSLCELLIREGKGRRRWPLWDGKKKKDKHSLSLLSQFIIKKKKKGKEKRDVPLWKHYGEGKGGHARGV